MGSNSVLTPWNPIISEPESVEDTRERVEGWRLKAQGNANKYLMRQLAPYLDLKRLKTPEDYHKYYHPGAVEYVAGAHREVAKKRGILDTDVEKLGTLWDELYGDYVTKKMLNDQRGLINLRNDYEIFVRENQQQLSPDALAIADELWGTDFQKKLKPGEEWDLKEPPDRITSADLEPGGSRAVKAPPQTLRDVRRTQPENVHKLFSENNWLEDMRDIFTGPDRGRKAFISVLNYIGMPGRTFAGAARGGLDLFTANMGNYQITPEEYQKSLATINPSEEAQLTDTFGQPMSAGGPERASGPKYVFGIPIGKPLLEESARAIVKERVGSAVGESPIAKQAGKDLLGGEGINFIEREFGPEDEALNFAESFKKVHLHYAQQAARLYEQSGPDTSLTPEAHGEKIATIYNNLLDLDLMAPILKHEILTQLAVETLGDFAIGNLMTIPVRGIGRAAEHLWRSRAARQIGGADSLLANVTYMPGTYKLHAAGEAGKHVENLIRMAADRANFSKMSLTQISSEIDKFFELALKDIPKEAVKTQADTKRLLEQIITKKKPILDAKGNHTGQYQDWIGPLTEEEQLLLPEKVRKQLPTFYTLRDLQFERATKARALDTIDRQGNRVHGEYKENYSPRIVKKSDTPPSQEAQDIWGPNQPSKSTQGSRRALEQEEDKSRIFTDTDIDKNWQIQGQQVANRAPTSQFAGESINALEKYDMVKFVKNNDLDPVVLKKGDKLEGLEYVGEGLFKDANGMTYRSLRSAKGMGRNGKSIGEELHNEMFLFAEELQGVENVAKWREYDALVPDGALQEFERFYKQTNNPKWMDYGKNMLRLMQTPWRINKTILGGMQYYVTNMIGNIGFTTMALGLKVLDPTLQAGAINTALLAAGSKRARNVPWYLPSGDVIPLSRVKEILEEASVFSQGMYKRAEDITLGKRTYEQSFDKDKVAWAGEKLANVAKAAESVAKNNPLSNVGKVMSNFGDDYGHAMIFLGVLKADTPEAIADALKFTGEYAGAMHKMASWEKNTLREATTFYTFNRFMVPRMVKTIGANPERVAWFHRFMRDMEKEWGWQNPDGPPDHRLYQGQMATLPEGMQPDDPNFVRSFRPEMGANMVAGYFDPGQSVTNLTGPIGAALFSMMSGVDYRTKKPLPNNVAFDDNAVVQLMGNEFFMQHADKQQLAIEAGKDVRKAAQTGYTKLPYDLFLDNAISQNMLELWELMHNSGYGRIQSQAAIEAYMAVLLRRLTGLPFVTTEIGKAGPQKVKQDFKEAQERAKESPRR